MSSKEMDSSKTNYHVCECGQDFIKVVTEQWSYINWNGGYETREYITPCPNCGSKQYVYDIFELKPMNVSDEVLTFMFQKVSDKIQYISLDETINPVYSYTNVFGETSCLYKTNLREICFLKSIIKEQYKRGDN